MTQDRRVLKDYPWYHRTPRFTSLVLPVIATLIFFSGPIYGVLTAKPEVPEVPKTLEEYKKALREKY